MSDSYNEIYKTQCKAPSVSSYGSESSGQEIGEDDLESITESISQIEWNDIDPFDLMSDKQRHHLLLATQRWELAELACQDAKAARDFVRAKRANERANLAYKSIARCKEFMRVRTLKTIGVDPDKLSDSNRQELDFLVA